MSQKQVLQSQIAQLPALEQIALVEEILQRLDAPDRSVDALWAIEAENRLTAYREGRVQAIALSEVLAKYRLP
ncbi:MAG: addiction module protein [Betaproteobacteria bacterium HGW-Betaproteobacteria-3]|jgi:putative addiction module component (TIGR02574 family)|nr:MAG: addiction module protein [Betaproteobacteria bacterium HGW-Betaproteobacteria-3]